MARKLTRILIHEALISYNKVTAIGFVFGPKYKFSYFETDVELKFFFFFYHVPSCFTVSVSGCEGTSPFVIGSVVFDSNTGILSNRAGL